MFSSINIGPVSTCDNLAVLGKDTSVRLLGQDSEEVRWHGEVRECGGGVTVLTLPGIGQSWHFHLVTEASVHIMCGAQYKMEMGEPL